LSIFQLPVVKLLEVLADYVNTGKEMLLHSLTAVSIKFCSRPIQAVPVTSWLHQPPRDAETNVGWGGQLNSHLMASCVRNICTKNYQNLLIGFKVTVKNVGDVFLRHGVVIGPTIPLLW